MQSLWRLVLVFGLASIAQAESIKLVTWNLQWFPGKGPTSTPLQRVIHMSEAKEALLSINPDVFCAQEIRDWDNFAELASVAPGLKTQIVSRHRDSPNGGAISIQQIGIGSRYPSFGAWSESFESSPHSPPRGFSFAAMKVGGKTLLIYSVHLKSNLGDLPSNIAKREHAARQILSHVPEMEKIYGECIIIVCGDFNTDYSDPRFCDEQTFSLFEAAGFHLPWRNVPLPKRITLPSEGKFPDASFDGFLIKGAVKVIACNPVPIQGVSDHLPVQLVLEL